jgi:hypothetical protein
LNSLIISLTHWLAPCRGYHPIYTLYSYFYSFAIEFSSTNWQRARRCLCEYWMMEGMKVLHPKPGAFFMGIKPLSEGEIGRMGWSMSLRSLIKRPVYTLLLILLINHKAAHFPKMSQANLPRMKLFGVMRIQSQNDILAWKSHGSDWYKYMIYITGCSPRAKFLGPRGS